MKNRWIAPYLLVSLSALACSLTASTGSPTPTEIPLPSQTLIPSQAPTPAPGITLAPSPVLETPTLSSTAVPGGQPDPRGEEAILILQPGPGSPLVSPARVAGVADTTFEQALAVQLVLDDGTILNTVPTTIQAELGQRGPFEVEIPFQVSEERQAFIQVFDSSARDGGLLHLASVGVLLLPGGEESVPTSRAANPPALEPQPERIEIFDPAPGAVVSGGSAHVEGFALASFEQTLVVQVIDAYGNIVGEQPVTVSAPDLGQPGPFSVDVPYSVASAGAGRVLVRDVSPAFGGDVHAASVEIQLEP